MPQKACAVRLARNATQVYELPHISPRCVSGCGLFPLRMEMYRVDAVDVSDFFSLPSDQAVEIGAAGCDIDLTTELDEIPETQAAWTLAGEE